jgi:type IV pilus assembly protein PilE
MELIIAVAIIGILAAIALPSYKQYILKSRRAEAKTALLDLAARQERYSSVNNTYASTPANLGYAGTGWPVDVQSSNQAYYQLRVTQTASPPAYSASAVPIGGQTQDLCATYTINNLGVQRNEGNTTATADCW